MGNAQSLLPVPALAMSSRRTTVFISVGIGAAIVFGSYLRSVQLLSRAVPSLRQQVLDLTNENRRLCQDLTSSTPHNAAANGQGIDKSEVCDAKGEHNSLTQIDGEKEVATASNASKVSADSESRLRAVLTSKGTTTNELRQAVLAVESLIDEAKRELSRMMLRDRRAAFEGLHEAIARGEEQLLEAAIEKARLAEVEGEDIAKGEAKLAELRGRTPEEKAKKLSHETESAKKKDAFIQVKRDNPDALKSIIDSLDDDMRWQDWRDYSGRSLWKWSQELKAMKVQSYLAALLGKPQPEEDGSKSSPQPQAPTEEKADSFGSGDMQGGRRRTLTPMETASFLKRRSLIQGIGSLGDEGRQNTVEDTAGVRSYGLVQSDSSSDGSDSESMRSCEVEQLGDGDHVTARESMRSCEAEEQVTSPLPNPVTDTGTDSTNITTTVRKRLSTAFGALIRKVTADALPPMVGHAKTEPADAEWQELKQKAFRSVARDLVGSLAEVLEVIPVETWRKWENKAGKDLLTLAEERKSDMAYKLLAQELGIVKEVHRDTFEDREDVWVFYNGELQPRQATVLEDTPAENDLVKIIFWDGDDDAMHIDRCFIHKRHG